MQFLRLTALLGLLALASAVAIPAPEPVLAERADLTDCEGV